MQKIVLSLSGGMDSATLLTKALREKKDVFPISFMYGSKHNPYELEMAKALLFHFYLANRWKKADVSFLDGLVKSDLMKSGGEIPEGHYEDESMRKTVVPGRNLIFISIMAAYAESIGAEQIWIGTHRGDHHIYPDCRVEFLIQAKKAVDHSTENKVQLMAPFALYDKAGLLQVGLSNSPNTPYHLTRTCYKDQPVSCGKCGSCMERLEAFKINGVEDPINYIK